MKKSLSLFSFVAVLLTVDASAAKPTAAKAGDDTAAVKQFVAELDRCSRAADLDGFMRQSADDVVFLPPDQPAVEGAMAVREWYKGFWTAFAVEMKHNVAEVRAAGDQVVVRGTATGIATPRAGGPPTAFDNKFLFVLRRALDGSLKAWRVAFNTHAPAADGDEARAALSAYLIDFWCKRDTSALARALSPKMIYHYNGVIVPGVPDDHLRYLRSFGEAFPPPGTARSPPPAGRPRGPATSSSVSKPAASPSSGRPGTKPTFTCVSASRRKNDNHENSAPFLLIRGRCADHRCSRGRAGCAPDGVGG